MKLAGSLNQTAMAGRGPERFQGIERRKTAGSCTHHESPAAQKNLLIADQISSD
jgi:hypothetical protein